MLELELLSVGSALGTKLEKLFSVGSALGAGPELELPSVGARLEVSEPGTVLISVGSEVGAILIPEVLSDGAELGSSPELEPELELASVGSALGSKPKAELLSVGIALGSKPKPPELDSVGSELGTLLIALISVGVALGWKPLSVGMELLTVGSTVGAVTFGLDDIVGSAVGLIVGEKTEDDTKVCDTAISKNNLGFASIIFNSVAFARLCSNIDSAVGGTGSSLT